MWWQEAGKQELFVCVSILPREKQIKAECDNARAQCNFSFCLISHLSLSTAHWDPLVHAHIHIVISHPLLDASTKRYLCIGTDWKHFFLTLQALKCLGNVEFIPGRYSLCTWTLVYNLGIWTVTSLTLNFLTEAWSVITSPLFWQFYSMKDSQTIKPSPVWDKNLVFQCPVHDHIGSFCCAMALNPHLIPGQLLAVQHEIPSQLRSWIYKKH